MTNNLYRGFQKAQALFMHALSPNVAPASPAITGYRSEAKSLFWNISPISILVSIFCADVLRPCRVKPFRMNILEIDAKKMPRPIGLLTNPKSLFRNILPVSPCGLRFCGQFTRYPQCNTNEIKILSRTQRKNVTLHSAAFNLQRRSNTHKYETVRIINRLFARTTCSHEPVE